ncbi:hypothetical protein, partial [Acidaminococcus sp.]|uniref:hypothetical protein n=1 Tax=Acidaminococcus sp. TaxID=1872103 RepID=UPI003D7C588D
MANWQGFTLTEKGLALQAKIDAGLATLIFTKISVGSGSSSSSPTDLVKREKDLTIASCSVDGTTVKLVSTLTNTGVKQAFKERELGLFATDPDDGEIMFAYMMDPDPDTMPAEGSTTVVSKRMTLNLTFSNTGNVSAVLDSSQLVTFADVKNVTNDTELEDSSDNKIASTSWVRGLLNSWKKFQASQISDFAEGIIKKLALTTAISAITALETNSWFGQLLKMVLTASGVKYNIAQNGYVCLGSFFGGLIIQWGYAITNVNGNCTITLPIYAKALNGVVSDGGTHPVYYAFHIPSLTV